VSVLQCQLERLLSSGRDEGRLVDMLVESEEG
jgi:hypothetical protein